MKIPLPFHLLGIAACFALGASSIVWVWIGLFLTLFLVLGLISRSEPSHLFVNTATIKGDSTVLWGSAGGSTIAGIIVSARDQATSEMVEIADNVGFTVTVVFFNQKNECEVEIIVQTSVPSLAVGDSVTIAGIAGCLVTSREVMWEQKGVRKLNVKATKWSGI